MAPAGLRAFRERDERKMRLYSYERARVKLDPALARLLRANPKAASFFAAQPAGYRKTAAFWVMSAKKSDRKNLSAFPPFPCPWARNSPTTKVVQLTSVGEG